MPRLVAGVTPVVKLRLVRGAHTAVWAGFVACIVGIPLAAHAHHFGVAASLVGVVAAEVVILLANRRRCPLTAVAARYTDNRAPNFDIYLPVWVARHNQALFGTLYAIGSVYALVRWLAAPT